MGLPLLILLLVPGILLIVLYNSLIRKKNAVANAFGAIDAMLKKRYDLLPNLVETVKQYMNYEQETLTKITDMRTRAVDAGVSSDQKIQWENQISSAMKNVMAQVENYPDLKANQNFLQLQGAWNEAEEQISAARRAYNAAVTDFNNAVEQFPTSLIARLLKFTVKPVLEIADEERKNVSARELFGN
jgi:LemA protein